LEVRGFTVALATDGQQAIDLFQACYPEIDLVILDLKPGEADPMWVLSCMKRIHAGVKVVAISDGDRFLRRDLIAHGVWSTLPRPLDVKAMLHKVAECLPSGLNWALPTVGQA
jgi:DNA-binding NtrC family response regulator